MEERSLRVVATDKTFFNKLTNTLTKFLIPTQIGFNSLKISMKRNVLIKTYETLNAENAPVEKKEELEKRYDDAYTAYLEALDKYVLDTIYKKVKNETATQFESTALSQYYGIVQLKDREYNEYKYRKQKYLLELDNESVKNTAKEKVIEKYNRFYVSKQDSLYKGILKNYSIKLADSTNIYDSSKDWIYVKIFNTLEDYMKNILPLKISNPKLESVSKDYEKYEKFKKQRINNVLADLNKSKILEFRKLFESLKNNIFSQNYGKHISLLLDSQVKAANKDSIILVFHEKSISETFNENIPLIEYILEQSTGQNIKIISTFLDDWTIIKNEFNSKQKKYEYDLNVIEELDVYKKILKNKNEIQEQFSDCIEYV